MIRGRVAVLVVAIAVVAGAAAWLVLRPATGAPELPGGAEAGREETSSSSERRSAGEAPGAPSSRIVPTSAVAQEDEPETGPGIRVKVVDAAGEPAGGVRVLLARETGGAVGSVWTSAPTEPATGLAMVAVPRAAATGTETRWFVTVDTPFIDGPEVDLDPANLPAEPIRIALGPTGRVEVLVRDASGELVTERTLVTLIDVTKEGSRPRIMLPEACARATTDGRVVFERVGLGGRLKAGARGDGRRFPEFRRADGPRVAGGEVTITLRPEVSAPIVKGRALDSDSRPLARRELQAVPFVGGVSMMRFTVQTDAEGRFRAEVLEGFTPGMRREFELRIERALDVVAASGRIDLSRDLPPGDTDVGDVVLAPPPVVAAGVVVDGEGKPVQGALFRIEALGRMGQQRPPGEWVRMSPASVSSGPDGRFEILGHESGPLRIQAWKQGFWSEEPAPIEAGRTDVVLRLNRGGRIEGSIVMPENLSAESLGVTALLEDQKAAEMRPDGAGFSQRPQSDGSFVFDGLRPGKFWLKVEVRNEEMLLAEVRGIDVAGGEVNRDPRLQKMDLSCMGKLVTLNVVDADNRLIPGAEAAEIADRVAGRLVPGAVARGYDGRVQFRLRRKAPEVVVGAPGFRRVVVPAVDADRTVVLERGLPIRLSLSASFAAEGLAIEARVEAEDAQSGELAGRCRDVGRWGSTSFQPGSSGALNVSEPGRYRVQLTLQKGRNTAWLATEMIVVANTEAEQSFAIAPSPGSLQKALEQVGAQ